jgi:uncharacterized membrane protein YcaP (DUF421 family)
MWSDMLDLTSRFSDVTVWEKILRTVAVYAFLVVALRLVGKRELGQSNTLDLVVLLLVANAVQNAIIGQDISVTGAFIGAATLFVVNEGVKRLVYRFPGLSVVVEGRETPLIVDGAPIRRNLRAEGISLPELRAIARRQGFEHLGEVETAILETNGVVTMFRRGEEHAYHPAEPGGPRLGKRRRTRH